MRFLSVAERGLRAGARHKRTHRLRWITAAGAFALLVWLMWSFNGFRAPEIFEIFSTITFFYCILIGTAQTADCLSSEKREGTLGLLFLTNLNGPEIVAGKLCSSALAAAYALFAIFPLLASQMLIGGITLAYFWRAVLALINVIFFSISAGFLASSVCVRQFPAVAWATGLALFFSCGMMAVAAVANAFTLTKPLVNWLAVCSPLYTFVAAEGGRVFGRNHYWGSLLAVTGISWFWLALATWRLSSSWRDRAMGPRVLARFELLREFRQRGQAGRAALRKRLLEINPFFWLGGPGQVSAPVFMLLTVILVIFTSFFAAPFFGRVLRAGKFSPMIGSLLAWFLAGLAIHAVLLYYAAMAASRRLAEDKQSGALELVLSTPTSERSISRGLWMAYGRKMFFPATMALLITLFVVWQGGAMAVLEPPALKIPPGTTASQLLWHGLLDRPIGGVRLEWPFVLMLRMVVLAFAMFVLIWLTLGCVGPWLGLRMKHPGFAPLASLALVLVPPTILFSVACFIADEINLDRLPQRLFVPIMIWVAFGIGVVHCLLLSFWTARRLRKDFRTIVTSRFQPPPLRPWWRPTRRTVVRFGFGGLAASTALLILVAAFYGYQNWQSRKAWSSFQDQLKQRNESLDLAVLLPAPAAENQNFARTPAYQGWVDPQARDASTRTLFDNLKQFEVQTAHPAISTLGLDWTHQGLAPLDKHLGWLGAQGVFSGKPTSADLATFLLQALERHKEPMRALADAARLPYFQPLTNRSARAVLVPARRDNGALERLHMLFQVRACALLATDRNTEAGEDVLASLELVRLARQIPDAQSSMRTQILLMRSLQPHWEGIVQHGWSGSQLAGFQSELSRINLLVDYTNAVYRVVLANIEQWQRFADRKSPRVQQPEGWEHLDNPVWQMQPRSWWLDNCAQLYQAGKAAIENVDVAGAHVYLGGRMSDLNGLPVGDQTTFLFQQPYWPGAYPGNVVFAQTALNQAIIACALERFRLAQGKYPELLQELVPEYLSTIPNDVVRGRPMLYENPNDGSFVLRSVGPNQSEDRNKPGSDDWLWSFPTNAPSAVVR